MSTISPFTRPPSRLSKAGIQEFDNAVGSNLTTTPKWAYEYPVSFLHNYVGWSITKVSLFSDDMFNAVGGNYSCYIYMGGSEPEMGTLVSTITVDVPDGLNQWVDWDLTTPVPVMTGTEPIWVVWQANTTVSSWPAGCCNGLIGCGTWWDGSVEGNSWEHITYGTWTMRQYFAAPSGAGLYSYTGNNPVVTLEATEAHHDIPVAHYGESANTTCANPNATRAGSTHPNRSGSFYNVYRALSDGSGTTLLANDVSGSEYVDETWSELAAGTYKYGVVAQGGSVDDAFWSNTIERPDTDPLTYAINSDGVSVTVTGHVDGTAATGSITIPETKTIGGVTYTVTAIGDEAFQNCSGLTGSLTIPNTVTEIGNYAFDGCIGFTGNLTLGSSVTTIGIFAFYYCEGLTGSLTIPNAVTMIGEGAFWDCPGFTSLTLGNSLTIIEDAAFTGCTGLTAINSLAVAPPTLGIEAFYGVSISIPVTVPCGSLGAYQAASGWSTFTNWIEPCPHEITATANPSAGGTVSGCGTYNHGASCTLTATANTGYTFVNWKKGSTVVSTNATYTFTVTEAGAYVANFSLEASGVQTNDFTSGWNWWNTYIEQEGIDGLAQLEESLGSDGIQIKSQGQYVNYYEGMGWMGMLSSVNNESSYKIKTSAACVVEMTGEATTSASHPITIGPGWNWIGYPVNSSMSVGTALSGITPANGDQLKALNGYANYYNGMGWMGTLSTLEPGMGLLYKSNGSGSFTLVYPEGAKGETFVENISSDNNHWVPDTHAYPDNMTVTAVVELDDVELASEGYELAAFADGECRGSVRLMYVEPINRYVAFLTIVGEDVTTLSFGLYDMVTGEEVQGANEQINFSNNAIVGDLREPYVIHFRGMTGVEEWANNIHVFPNPVARGENVSLSTTEEIGKVQIEIINALGVVVETLRTTSLRATIAAPSVAGVYTLRITTEGKGTCYKKLVVR